MAPQDPHRDGPLADYRRKRDFARTPEPHGAHPPEESGGTGRFVVQIHDATRMHFDFRLEVDGVLKSWAVPRGPARDPADKRLAVPTEDHPLDYRDFEGVIAHGEYGGGTVIVWDQGTYRGMGDVPFAEALAAGHASFWMDGAKLHGGYALTRTGDTWLLVKRKDEYAAKADAPDPWRARSVLTGRTLRQVAADREAVRVLLREAGTTYAEDAGIHLADKPAPLWRLLVLTNLLAARIKAPIAVAAARELFAAGAKTPDGMAELTWQQRVDALGRGHYRRYDEGTATRLGDCADLVRERYGGDLRRLAEASGHDRGHLVELLCEFPGMGPTAADIFCREVQAVWLWLRPALDRKALDAAHELGLPDRADHLAALVPGDELAAFAAGLVRVGTDRHLADDVRAAAHV